MTEKTGGIIPTDSGQKLFTPKPSGASQGRKFEQITQKKWHRSKNGKIG
jgi:hypothetical protein